MYCSLPRLISGLMLLVLNGTASANEPNACMGFTVHSNGGSRAVTYVDHNPLGKSIGDQRIGYRSIRDAENVQIGEQRWIASVVEVAQSDAVRDQTSAEGVFTFPKGSNFCTRPAAATYVSPESVEKVAGRGPYIVIGGSGIFQGAQGVVDREGKGRIATAYVFDIRCD